MKKLMALILVMFILLTCVACAGGEEKPAEQSNPVLEEDVSSETEPKEEEKENLRIAFIAQDWSVDYFVQVRDGVRMSVREGDEVLYYDYANDINKEISTIEDCIARQVDVIICNCYDVEGLYPVFMEAKEAGIPIITFEKTTDYTDLVVTQIKTDDIDMAYVGTQKLIEVMGNTGKATCLEVPSSAAITLRLEGFKKAIEEANGSVISTDSFPQSGGSMDTEGNTAAFDALLQNHPDLTGYFGTNQNSTLVFVSCAEAAGMLDQISIVTVDATESMQKLLLEGKIDGIIDQQAYYLGEMLAQAVYDYFDGKEIEPLQTVPVQIVTTDNYDEWVKTTVEYTQRAEALSD